MNRSRTAPPERRLWCALAGAGWLLAAGSVHGTVTVELQVGDLPVVAGTVGILVADRAGDGFFPLESSTVIGTSLETGATLGASDDVVVAVFQARNLPIWQGGTGFAEVLGGIDYDDLGLVPGVSLKLYWLEGVTSLPAALTAGQTYGSLRSRVPGATGGTIPFSVPANRGVYSIVMLTAAVGGDLDLGNPGPDHEVGQGLVGPGASVPDLSSTSDSGEFDNDGITNIDTPILRGTGPVGTLVTLTSDRDGVVGSVTVGANGEWEITTNALTDGVHQITASDGGTSSAPFELTIDTVAPPAPTGLDLDDMSDTGTSDSDNITMDEAPKINGASSEAGVLVLLTSDLEGAIGTATSTAEWSVVSSSLRDGIHELTARARDLAGNVGPVSATLSVTVDTEAPELTVNQAGGQADPIAAGPVRFSAIFSEAVSGFTESDVLTVGSVAGAVSVSGGPASFEVLVATTGNEGAVTASIGAGAATDLAGNPSGASISTDNTVTLDGHGGDAGSATALAFASGSAMADGWLGPSDTDVFSFTLSKAQTVDISTTGNTDTRGELRTAGGALLNDPVADADAGSGSNFRTSTFLGAGTYTITVIGEGSAPTGAYALRIDLGSVPLLINEVDATSQGGDTREFIELFDGGAGNFSLNGYVLVLFAGATGQSYAAFDLDGKSTDGDGYFVIGNTSTPTVDQVIPDGTLQGGVNAVALFVGNESDFPNGTDATILGLADAVVYDTGQSDDPVLLALLNADESQVDEDGSGNAEGHSIQRLPNGAGGARNTDAFAVLSPTPGAENSLPPAPAGLDLTSASDTGASQIDNITNLAALTITGTARAGSTVTLVSSIDGEVGTVVTDETGNWSIVTDPLTEGTHEFGATADNGPASAGLNVTLDTTPPTLTFGKASGQSDPASSGPILFTATFNENVNGFSADKVTVGGSAGGTASVSGGPAVYTVSVAVTSEDGIVTAFVGADAGTDTAGNTSGSPNLGDTSVTLDEIGTTSLAFSENAASSDGWLDPSDTDLFSFTLSEPSTVVIQTTGSVDTRGVLTTDSGSSINVPEEDRDAGTGSNFLIEEILPPGTYHLFVTSEGAATSGVYTLLITKTAFPILINELDAQTQSGDMREFIELFDGGAGNSVLDGLVLVFFDGSSDISYYAIDLDGYSTNADGYFVAGNTETPNVDLVFPDSTLQDGADAVALFIGDATDFPNGAAVTTANLIDAIVHDTGQSDDVGLLTLLNATEPQLSEDAEGNAVGHSLQRLPNGSGGVRNTTGYSVLSPTPGGPNGLPSAPTDLDLTSGSDTGFSQADNYTRDDTPTITGTARAGAIITLISSIEGSIGTGIADETGVWSVTASTLGEGSRDLTATADGGPPSAALTITIDITPPAVPTGLDLTTDSGVSSTDNITNDNTPDISGNAESGSMVTLYVGSIEVGSTIADGAWNITASSLTDGAQAFTATAMDTAGNTSVASSALNVTIDTTPPSVTLNVAAGQNDPASSGPVLFTAAFSEQVSGFATGDISTGGNAAGTVSLSGGSITFTISVAVTSTEGFVTASLSSAVVTDLAGNGNLAATSTDNRIDLDSDVGPGGLPIPVVLSSGTGVFSAYLHPADVDAFSFSLPGPRIVRIRTESDLDTRGELRDSLDLLRNDPDADDDAGDVLNFLITEPLPAGNYVVAVSAASGIGDYSLHIEAVDLPAIQPDISLNGRGNDAYSPAVQLLPLVSRSARPVTAIALVENDGEIPDSFTLRAARGNAIFRVVYTNPDDGNITANLVVGSQATALLQPDDPAYRILTRISPNKRKVTGTKVIRKNGKKMRQTFYLRKTYNSRVDAISNALESQRDSAIIRVQTK